MGRRVGLQLISQAGGKKTTLYVAHFKGKQFYKLLEKNTEVSLTTTVTSAYLGPRKPVGSSSIKNYTQEKLLTLQRE
jgi:hypothetical protein